jgi:hypothetical protein
MADSLAAGIVGHSARLASASDHRGQSCAPSRHRFVHMRQATTISRDSTTSTTTSVPTCRHLLGMESRLLMPSR